jgi:hypothetical protein
MTSWVDKVQAAVDARVLDVTVTHRRELLAEVCAVLVQNFSQSPLFRKGTKK